jgi:hypothetical protein
LRHNVRSTAIIAKHIRVQRENIIIRCTTVKIMMKLISETQTLELCCWGDFNLLAITDVEIDEREEEVSERSSDNETKMIGLNRIIRVE